MKNLRLVVLILLTGLCFVKSGEGVAQCAMCKATIENSSGSEQATMKQRAKGLNLGILYLMCIPYVLAGIIGYFWYRNSKKERERKIEVQRIAGS